MGRVKDLLPDERCPVEDLLRVEPVQPEPERYAWCERGVYKYSVRDDYDRNGDPRRCSGCGRYVTLDEATRFCERCYGAPRVKWDVLVAAQDKGTP